MLFIISFLTILQLSFEGKNISIGRRQNRHSYIGDFDPGLIAVPLIVEKGYSFLIGFLITLLDMPFVFFYHFTISSFYFSSAVKPCEIDLGTWMYICKDAIQIFTYQNIHLNNRYCFPIVDFW